MKGKGGGNIMHNSQVMCKTADIQEARVNEGHHTSLDCDKSSQSLPQFRNQTVSPYLGGPASCESVR